MIKQINENMRILEIKLGNRNFEKLFRDGIWKMNK